MSDKLPQPTEVLIARLRRAAVGIDKIKAGELAKPEALNAYANTCWQCAARLEELAARLLGDPAQE
jgi:hypothetical protein